MKIRRVDGCWVRDHLDVDFTMGGHPARYSYIPADEVWIDACLPGKDQACTIVHELVEMRLMAEHGMRYGNAHELASRTERLMRAEVDERLDESEAEAVAHRWLDW